MKKTVYILGSIEILAGTLLLCITSIIEKVLPVLGRVAYQAAGGSYSPTDYEVSFLFVTIVSVLLIVVGIVQIVFLHWKKIGSPVLSKFKKQ